MRTPNLFDEVHTTDALPARDAVPCAFCGGDAGEPGHAARCAGRQGQAEADALPYDAGDVTRTTGEAFAVLEARRASFLASARDVARELIQRDGSTHGRAVRDEMQARGMLDESTVREFWLGAIFRDRSFEWNGRWHLPDGKPERNIHAWRPVKVWTLRTVAGS